MATSLFMDTAGDNFALTQGIHHRKGVRGLPALGEVGEGWRREEEAACLLDCRLGSGADGL